RNSDSYPRVTISGGRLQRAMSQPLRAPPMAPIASAPIDRVHGDHPASRQSAPNTTALRPSSAPHDKSMPPVTTMGVSASASSPNSTPSRTISAALAEVAKLGAVSAKIADSATSTPASTSSARLVPV